MKKKKKVDSDKSLKYTSRVICIRSYAIFRYVFTVVVNKRRVVFIILTIHNNSRCAQIHTHTHTHTLLQGIASIISWVVVVVYGFCRRAVWSEMVTMVTAVIPLIYLFSGNQNNREIFAKTFLLHGSDWYSLFGVRVHINVTRSMYAYIFHTSILFCLQTNIILRPDVYIYMCVRLLYVQFVHSRRRCYNLFRDKLFSLSLSLSLSSYTHTNGGT